MTDLSSPHLVDVGHGNDRAKDYLQRHDMPFIGLAVTPPATRCPSHVNATLCDMLGYAEDALIGKSWAELAHPEDLDDIVDVFGHAERGETDGCTRDRRLVRADGSTLAASIGIRAIRAIDGAIEFFVVTVHDVSARTEAERAARASAALLENLSRQVPGVIYQFLQRPDGSSCFPFASDAIREIYEVEPGQVVESAALVWDRIHPDDQPMVEASVAESARTLEPWRCDYRVILPRRGLRWLRGDARPERLPDGGTLWHGFITDDSERKDSARDLLRLEAAITASINGVAIADLDGVLRYVNRALLDLWGHADIDAVMGRNVTDFWLHPEETAAAMAELTGTGAFVGEMSPRCADAVDRLFQVNASLFPDAAGNPAGMLASFVDITERRRTEEALRVRDEAIRAAITAIAICDPTGRPMYVNPAFVRLWGYADATEVLGRAVNDFLAVQVGTPRPRVQSLFTDGAWQGELRARRKDQSEFDALVSVSVVRNDQGEVTNLMGSFIDVTESKRLQADVLQAQKMESVGRLAGGVAHDFNNLLTVMKGCLDLALASAGATGALRAELEEINRAADSAAGLTRQLLAFSRKQIIAPRILDLNDVVHRVHGLLLRLLGEDVRLQVTTAPGLGAVRFDPGQAEQILVNLAVNARDAMPDGGLLTLETSNVRLDEEYARMHPGTDAGDYVLLAVSDTGVGMTPETRTHVFEPFFTTKEIGQGTGLGLAMIHGAVSQNGGRVEVYSEVGHGTSFKILLPRVVEQPTVATDAPRAGVLPRGTETVVLVEDDPAVRQLVVRLLERQGYRVFSFAGGAALLEWMADWQEPIHLLLTDVIMPGMNGRVLAEHVRTIRPETRVLYASGYTANVIVQHGVLKPGVEFLAKPFTAATLAETVRELLDRD